VRLLAGARRGAGFFAERAAVFLAGRLAARVFFAPAFLAAFLATFLATFLAGRALFLRGLAGLGFPDFLVPDFPDEAAVEGFRFPAGRERAAALRAGCGFLRRDAPDFLGVAFLLVRAAMAVREFFVRRD